MVRGITDLPFPTIAMVNGAAVGAGFDLALACDMRVGSESARMRVAFTALGIVPGTGATWLLPRIVGLPKACELIFTADFIDGKLAKELGIFNHLAPPDQLESVTMALASKIAKGPPIAMKLDKMLIHKGYQMNIESALEMIAGCAPIGLTSEDHVEGVKAFIEKREPDFKGR